MVESLRITQKTPTQFVIDGAVYADEPESLRKESGRLVERLLQLCLEAEPTLNSCRIYLVTETLRPLVDTSPLQIAKQPEML
jgi:hypothetical protein